MPVARPDLDALRNQRRFAGYGCPGPVPVTIRCRSKQAQKISRSEVRSAPLLQLLAI